VRKLLQPDFTSQRPRVGADEFWKGDEWGAAQMGVAQEVALSASLDVIRWQAEAWRDLTDALEDVGIQATISANAQVELDEMLAKLRASIVVAKEVLGIDETYLKGITNER